MARSGWALWSGGVGVPGEFTFTQGSPGVVEFEYSVDYSEPSPGDMSC